MDFVKNAMGGGDKDQQGGTNLNEQRAEGGSDGGFLGGIGNKLNSAAGGGRESEKNEDLLDKGLPSQPHTLSLPNFSMWSPNIEGTLTDI